jgi:hypothetical protein
MLNTSFGKIAATSATIAALIVPAIADAQNTPAPPLVAQINSGNWLSRRDAESLRDELFYQRAIFAYQTMLPALNTIVCGTARRLRSAKG